MRLAARQPLLNEEEDLAAIVPIMAFGHEDNLELNSEFEPLLRWDRERLLDLQADGIVEM
ncbi:MAG TPA: hypothetical protein VGD45_22955 [Steroidobacter sp.]|uniref:hypothetical protein n=1 Tax=Steroidobacter sp. TaxID=1978227 RepID=UPI002EDAC4EE